MSPCDFFWKNKPDWNFRLETEFLSKENTTTGWNEYIMRNSHNEPCMTSVPQLNEHPS